VLKGNSNYVVDSQSGLKLLRKNAVISGSKAIIKTNSLGLRSVEIPPEKSANTVRIALVGASSVMGTYTRNNEETLAAQLTTILNSQLKHSTVEVLNAGIAGYGLDDQKKLLTHLVVPLNPDIVILYPGFNDLAHYCKSESTPSVDSYSLVDIKIPKWVLTTELITKNTTWLRQSSDLENKLEPQHLDTSSYQEKLRDFFQYVSSLEDTKVLLVTNPRAFSTDMPATQQRELASSALYYYPCFSVAALNELFDSHNEMLVNKARAHNIEVYPLDVTMPKGSDMFGDSSHFSTKGTQVAAELIAPVVLSNWLSKN
jgi:lysophospholipase L1-like esterase